MENLDIFVAISDLVASHGRALFWMAFFLAFLACFHVPKKEEMTQEEQLKHEDGAVVINVFGLIALFVFALVYFIRL